MEHHHHQDRDTSEDIDPRVALWGWGQAIDGVEGGMVRSELEIGGMVANLAGACKRFDQSRRGLIDLFFRRTSRLQLSGMLTQDL
jgi:hypothetical protein